MTTNEFIAAMENEAESWTPRAEPSAEVQVTGCRDLNALLLLNRLAPVDDRIIEAAEHDQIWLNVNIDALAAAITREQVHDLYLCGVFYDGDLDSLSMYR